MKRKRALPKVRRVHAEDDDDVQFLEEVPAPAPQKRGRESSMKDDRVSVIKPGIPQGSKGKGQKEKEIVVIVEIDLTSDTDSDSENKDADNEGCIVSVVKVGEGEDENANDTNENEDRPQIPPPPLGNIFGDQATRKRKQAFLYQTLNLQANTIMNGGNYMGAKVLLTSFLRTIDNDVYHQEAFLAQMKARVYYNMAVVELRRHNLQEVVVLCNKAWDLDDRFLWPRCLRGDVYITLAEYTRAKRDFEYLKLTIEDIPYSQYLPKVKQTLKEIQLRQNSSDHYANLNIKRDATIAQIKRQYHVLAKLYHPDRHPNANNETKQEVEEKFKLIQNAYSVLSDSFTRFEYDSKPKPPPIPSTFWQFNFSKLDLVFQNNGISGVNF